MTLYQFRALGAAIEPLYEQVPKAAKKDLFLYEMLALADIIRVGKVRETQIAIQLLKERIYA